MGTLAKEPISLLGQEFARCPLAILRDMPPDSRMEVDQVIRLSIAKRNGNLSPYPGNYSLRGLCLIDFAESELMRMQEQAREEAQRQAEVEAKRKAKGPRRVV